MVDAEQTLIALAISEDLAGGVDITSHATIPAEQISTAFFVTRSAGVISGVQVAADVLRYVGITDISVLIEDGTAVGAQTVVLKASGNTRQLLLAERTALNFLTHLSGISTQTRRWVELIAETKCQIRDTRKTTPGFRTLEKAAVRAGGGTNHRMSLSDAALVKDNHIVAAGGVLQAFELVRQKYPNSSIEVEVDTLDQLRSVLTAQPDLILLDNMTPDVCAAAVELVAGSAKLEASGGITFDNALAYARSGVDYLAIGALTHSFTSLDIGLDLEMGV